jgi:hypothetical protein
VEAVTSNDSDKALARRLGIQPCHVHANRLLDLAEQKDREGYRALLDQIFVEHGANYQSQVNRLAKRQLRMEQHDHRINPWRSVWMENAKGQR